MEIDNLIEAEVLKAIRKYLDDPSLTDFEKLDHILLASGKLVDVQRTIHKFSIPIAVHIIKQIMYPNLYDWSDEIADNFLNEFVTLEYKTKKWHQISKEFLLKEMQNSRVDQKGNKLFRRAKKEVEKGAKRKGNKKPEIQNNISIDQFIIVWDSFCECISEKLDHDKDFEKKDVRTCIEQAAKKSRLDIEFLWR